MEQTTSRPYRNSPLTPIPHETRVQAGLKAAEKNIASDPDYYSKLGQRGGSAPHKARGFELMSPAKRRAAGKKGGTVSRKKREES